MIFYGMNYNGEGSYVHDHGFYLWEIQEKTE